MRTFIDFCSLIVLSIVAAFGLGAVFAGIEMWLWNQVMPEVFGLRQITFWQALCISWLCTMLLKSVPAMAGKTDDHLERISDLSSRQEYLLQQIVELQQQQVFAVEEVQKTLQYR